MSRSLGALGFLAALMLAACGSIGQPSGTATGAASSAPGGADPALALARCLRTHGLTNFPDPKPGAGIQIGPGINPESPAFKSAQQACRRYLPNGGTPPATNPHDRAAALAFDKCMRVHGVPGFPDPALTPPRNAQRALVMRGMVFAIGTSIDPSSPAFQQASRACGLGPP